MNKYKQAHELCLPSHFLKVREMPQKFSVKNSSIWNRSKVAAAISVILSTSSAAYAESAGTVPDSKPTTGESQELATALDTVVVTGTRRSGRTVAESTVPIDVLTPSALESIPSSDLNDKLSRLVPSYQVQRNTIADGNIFFRSATLRNLSPDHTLVLVNGKRRHRSAYIETGQFGSQAVDLSQIPTIALKRVEVLRDGASAQYGSDAIAGVINLIPDDHVGFKGYLQSGQYYEGDGENNQTGFNLGVPLSDRGTLNISFESNDAKRTSRGDQNLGAQALTQGGGVFGDAAYYQQNIKDPVQRFGQPEQTNYRSFVNFNFDLNDNVALYAFGTYSEAKGENDFIWRNPETNTYFNPLPIWGDYSLRSKYPGGFTPVFGMESTDHDVVIGAKGLITDTLSWDLSTSHGRNKIKYLISDTINASLGPDSPTKFDAGTRTQTEHGLNLDFVFEPSNSPLPVTVAFGTEYRKEEFAAGVGDEASYSLGPGAAFGYPGGANGFFGTDPTQAGTFDRHSVAAYVDVESQLTDRWDVGVATRFENFSEGVGSSQTGKLSTRYAITDSFALRGALSTGFRAPTPGQANLTNTSQRPSPDGLSILTRGTIPSTNAAAELRGGKALKPERSVNLSAGFTWELTPRTNLTVDYYNIEVKDRLGLSPNYSLTDSERTALVASGVTSAQGLSTFNYYVNGFTTETQGVDVVLAQRFQLPEDINLNVTSLYNYNRTHVTDSDVGVISDLSRQSLQDRLPRHKASITLDLARGNISGMLRGTYYSGWTQPFWDDVSQNQRFGSEIFLDASVSYSLTKELKATLGAENFLNNYPDREKSLNILGTKYPLYRPYEGDGARYFLRLDYSI